jgi:60 kDa SS-A/Ro ribonucleoprotein
MVPAAAGGNAYSLDNDTALAQYAVTGIFKNCRSASPKVSVDQLLEFARACEPKYVAQVAIYASECGDIRDTPVLLTAYLSTVEDKTWFNKAFDTVIYNVGQLRKFTTVIRSNTVGRRNMSASSIKKAVQRFFDNKTADRLFWQNIGSTPTLADVVKLTHPRPNTLAKDAYFAYLTNKPCAMADLPEKVRHFEAFKKGDRAEVPDVPFLRLTSMNLNTSQWEQVFRRMTWNQLRMNINNANRKELFLNKEFTTWVVEKLQDPKAVAGSRVLPMALLTSLTSFDEGVPLSVVTAVRTALDHALSNAPVIDGNLKLIIDTSGSMHWPVKEEDRRERWNPKKNVIRRIDIAATFGSAILKANPETSVVYPVDEVVWPADEVKPTNTLLENAQVLINKGGGGTDISCGLEAVLKDLKAGQPVPDLVVIISDNESWIDTRTGRYHKHTATMDMWNRIKSLHPTARLVCWNVDPELSTQASDREDILNIGGYSDSVFSLISHFYNAKTPQHWAETIKSVEI